MKSKFTLPAWVKVGKVFLMWDDEDSCFYQSRVTEIDEENEAVMYVDIDEKSNWNGHTFETSYEELNNPKLAKEK